MKTDLKAALDPLYKASARAVQWVEVPPLDCLMIDGEGDPNREPAFAEAVEALFTVSYTLKFMVKKGPQAIDYGVMPLEGLWWADDMADFTLANKARWKWTLLIVQPPFITAELLALAKDAAAAKKPLPALPRLRLSRLEEGLAGQLLHVGPFETEGPTIARLHAALAERGTLRGLHHEIYLSDTRRGDPARWKTIVRQPCTPHAASA